MAYLSSSDLEGLKNYKYVCGEDSVGEKLIMPFWNWAVRLLPMWMAPNVVTLLGLGIVVVSSMLYLPFDLKMTDEFPAWTYAVSGLAVFTYMTMDVLDGKQARRTGSSSPLGQMFDHGCDAWSCQFFLYFPIQIFRIGLSPVSALYYFALTGIFFAAQWEEYHTGVYRTSQYGVGLTESYFYLISLIFFQAFSGGKLSDTSVA